MVRYTIVVGIHRTTWFRIIGSRVFWCVHIEVDLGGNTGQHIRGGYPVDAVEQVVARLLLHRKFIRVRQRNPSLSSGIRGIGRIYRRCQQIHPGKAIIGRLQHHIAPKNLSNRRFFNIQSVQLDRLIKLQFDQFLVQLILSRSSYKLYRCCCTVVIGQGSEVCIRCQGIQPGSDCYFGALIRRIPLCGGKEARRRFHCIYYAIVVIVNIIPIRNTIDIRISTVGRCVVYSVVVSREVIHRTTLS